MGPPLFERDVGALVSDDIFRPNSDGDDDDDGCQDDRGVPSPDREGGGRGEGVCWPRAIKSTVHRPRSLALPSLICINPLLLRSAVADRRVARTCSLLRVKHGNSEPLSDGCVALSKIPSSLSITDDVAATRHKKRDRVAGDCAEGMEGRARAATGFCNQSPFVEKSSPD